jgi:hypothetical protein
MEQRLGAEIGLGGAVALAVWLGAAVWLGVAFVVALRPHALTPSATTTT